MLYSSGGVMTASLLLGGGAHSGFLSDAILQLCALPLLILALWRLGDARLASSAWWALRFCLVVVLLPLLQLIPLPPAVWTLAPNSALRVEALQFAGESLSWAPLSLSPRETWLSALSLAAPVAVFLGVVLLDRRERRLLSLALLALGVVSVFLGLLQIAQGPESSLRFFAFTNPSEAVGFFANRNHYAALLYTMTLFAAAWAIAAAMAVGATPGRKSLETPSVAAVAAGFTTLVALVGAQAMARSRAGVGLCLLALFGAFVLAVSVSDRRHVHGVTPVRLLGGGVAVGMIFAVQFALYRLLARFAADPMADARIPFARNTLEAAVAFLPFGSGMGSFAPVYGLFERPQDLIANAFANHAHNDVLEFWLEAGVAGIGVMAWFVGWLISRAAAVWRSAAPGEGPIDALLPRAATMAVALLMLHSLVDYPLRTTAMMTVMAFACGLLVEPPMAPGGHEAEVAPGQTGGPGHRGRWTGAGVVSDERWRDSLS